MIRFPSSVLPLARALLVATALSAAQLVHAQAPGLGLNGVTQEELARFATTLRSAIESGKWQQVEAHIAFPLRVNTGPGRFRLVNRVDFVSEYGQLFGPQTRAAILARDAGGLQELWRGANAGSSPVTVSGVCMSQRCSTVVPKIVAVTPGEP